jgi:hypothetical protein
MRGDQDRDELDITRQMPPSDRRPPVVAAEAFGKNGSFDPLDEIFNEI